MFDAYFQLGYVVGTHGLQGELKVHLDADDPYYYNNLESVFLNQNGKLIPFFIEHLQIGDKNKSLLKLEEIDSIESAAVLKGCELWLPESFLPPLAENEFYFHDVIGYTAKTSENTIGIIEDYYSEGPQEIFSIKNEGKEIMIPVVDEFIKEINHEEKYILFELPEGLIELYLNED